MIEKLSKDLMLQYKGYRVLFWIMLVIATVLGTCGLIPAAITSYMIAMVSAIVANQKWVMMNQEVFNARTNDILHNQIRIEDKLNVSLGLED